MALLRSGSGGWDYHPTHSHTQKNQSAVLTYDVIICHTVCFLCLIPGREFRKSCIRSRSISTLIRQSFWKKTVAFVVVRFPAPEILLLVETGRCHPDLGDPEVIGGKLKNQTVSA